MQEHRYAHWYNWKLWAAWKCVIVKLIFHSFYSFIFTSHYFLKLKCFWQTYTCMHSCRLLLMWLNYVKKQREGETERGWEGGRVTELMSLPVLKFNHKLLAFFKASLCFCLHWRNVRDHFSLGKSPFCSFSMIQWVFVYLYFMVVQMLCENWETLCFPSVIALWIVHV